MEENKNENQITNNGTNNVIQNEVISNQVSQDNNGKKSKGLAVILIIIGILLLCGGAYFGIKYMNKEKENNPNGDGSSSINENDNSSSSINGNDNSSSENSNVIDNKFMINDDINYILSYSNLLNFYQRTMNKLDTSTNNCNVTKKGEKTYLKFYYDEDNFDEIEVKNLPNNYKTCINNVDEGSGVLYILTESGELYYSFYYGSDISTLKKFDYSFEIVSIELYTGGIADAVSPIDSLILKTKDGEKLMVNENWRENILSIVSKDNLLFTDYGILNIEIDGTITGNKNLKMDEIISTHSNIYVIDSDNYLYVVESENKLKKISEKKIIKKEGYKILINRGLWNSYEETGNIIFTFED